MKSYQEQILEKCLTYPNSEGKFILQAMLDCFAVSRLTVQLDMAQARVDCYDGISFISTEDLQEMVDVRDEIKKDLTDILNKYKITL